MAAVKQVTTITIGGTIAIGNTLTFTVGFASLPIVMTGATTALAATQITDALNASGIPPEFTEFTYSVAGSVITATAKVAGVPIVITGAVTTGSGTITISTPTAATGPNFVDVAANWSGATLPVVTDTIAIESGPPMLYGLGTITGLMASVVIEAGMSEAIGLPETNAAGYPEYRAQYWAINTSALTIGGGTGRLSPRIKLNLGSVATAIVIEKTGQQFGGEWPVQIIGGSNATAYILGGQVSFAGRATEVCSLTSLNVAEGATVICGAGVTHTTIDSTGSLLLANTVTTLRVHGGTTYLQAAATTLVIDGGTLVYQALNTLPSVTVGPGTLDLSDVRPRTITSLTLKRNATVRDPRKTATITTTIIAADSTTITTSG